MSEPLVVESAEALSRALQMADPNCEHSAREWDRVAEALIAQGNVQARAEFLASLADDEAAVEAAGRAMAEQWGRWAELADERDARVALRALSDHYAEQVKP